MTTAAYIRVSSDKQDVTRQRTNISAAAGRLGQPIGQWFEDSEGKNPRHKAEQRKEFQRLLKAVKARAVDTIFVDSQDRFGTKDAFEWGEFISILRKHGCQLIDSTGRKLSADDDGAVLTGVVGALTSKREQKEKAHRSIGGKVTNAKKGEYQGGYAPYGLDVVCFGPDGKEKWRTVYIAHFDRWKVYPNGKRERFTGKNVTPAKDSTDTLRLRPSIEKERLKFVKQVFKWFTAEDITPQQIANRLNDLQVKPVFGEAWYKHTIRAMLANPVYLGRPTWNKRGASEFIEYVGGQLREVNGAKRGRHRDASDFVQPEKPEFPPVIDDKTWEAAQAKLKPKGKKHKRPPHNAELWLRGFLHCGHCGKPMHGSAGNSTPYLKPSYLCGTYNKYGAKNSQGCRCHRVQHSYLEPLVLRYVEETAPKLAKLLKATEGGDLEEIRPILAAVNGSAGAFSQVACDVLAFIGENADDAEVAKLLKQGRDFAEVYGVVFERLRPKLEGQIAGKEAELDKLLDQYATLPEKLRQRAIDRMEPVQAELDDLKGRLIDWRGPYQRLRAELDARREGLAKARATIGKAGAERQKADALRGVVDKIVCHFRYEQKKGSNYAKSYLDRVEFVAVSGESLSFSAEASPAPS